MGNYKKDIYTKAWITRNCLEEIKNYDPGVLTLRALHYRMVSRGMTNTIRHYKRVVSAMIAARWENLIPFNTFSDHDREALGKTDFKETTVEEKSEDAKWYINHWLNNYSKNRWENQENYIEVWIEKKALIGTFKPVCESNNILLAPCKGYPSLTFLNDAKKRFIEALKTHKIKILYFGDYDPSGEDIPRSLKQNLYDMGVDVEVDRKLLLKEDVIKMDLPPAPAKLTDSRTANWDGLGQVELDAVEPSLLASILEDAIEENYDIEKAAELTYLQAEEKEEYKNILKEWVKTL